MREMKNSHIPFCENIPASWSEIPNKYIFSCHSAKVGEKSSEYQLLSLTTSGVKEKSATASGGKVPTSYDGYQTVEIGDMIFCLFDLDCSAVFSGLSPYNGMITSAYDVLRANPNRADNHFLEYWFQYVFSNRYYKMFSKNIRYTVTGEMFNSIYTPIPPIEEQKRIGSYLDKLCKKVDALIANQESQIEKLKAYKQSLITEVVTKGLDPNAPMKDSGVDEIGFIPENFDVRKTLLCLEMPITDGPHTTPELFDEGIPFVSAEAVSCGNGGIDFSHIRGFISQDFYEECCKKYVPQIDDIYMIKSGATTGRVSIVDTNEVFTIWSPLAVFRCNNDVVKPRYMFYYLQSKCYQQQVELGWSYGTQQNIGMRTLEKLKVIVPPLDVQKRIVEYLDFQFKKANELISIKQQKIEKLNQYKKSLIYEYVTGKKEVIG